MSNKIVPTVYRAIIDDVIANVSVDFEEYGMDDEVLQLLQAKWESKLLETRVADFARAPNASSTSPEPKHHQQSLSTNGGQAMTQPAYGLSFPSSAGINAHQHQSHGLALPGSSSSFAGPSNGYGGMGGISGISGMNVGGMNGMQGFGGMINGQTAYGDIKPDPEELLRLRGGAPEEKKDTKPYVKQEPNAAGLLPGDEVIDSDLDDSDDELRDDNDEEGEGEVDIVFCVYDKVQRVKNKWKTVFKDGMIHINGRDYLFAKCNGEFEW